MGRGLRRRYATRPVFFVAAVAAKFGGSATTTGEELFRLVNMASVVVRRASRDGLKYALTTSPTWNSSSLPCRNRYRNWWDHRCRPA